MLEDKVNDQYIITYEDASDGKIRKYTTCYTENKCKEQLINCLERHGRGSNAKIVPAKKLNTI